MLVRPGLAIYGYCLPMEDERGAAIDDAGELCAQLEPVLAWKTRILATREIAAGQTVGYGATFVSGHPMRLALLPVGYADGFRREASSSAGGGWVIIACNRAPVVGRVSMNLTVVDVTEIAEADEGVEVTLLGDGVSAADHAQWCGTIPYEILCGIRAHRRLVERNASGKLDLKDAVRALCKLDGRVGDCADHSRRESRRSVRSNGDSGIWPTAAEPTRRNRLHARR